MRARASLIISVISLAICVVCPLLDMFDQWDHVLQTGHDTEYPLVVLALCIGAAFVLARLIITLSSQPLVSKIRFALQYALNAALGLTPSATLIPAQGSPPLSLRI